MDTIDITGLDKAELLAALHAGTHAQGMSVNTGALSLAEAREIVRECSKRYDATTTEFSKERSFYFDYLRGRVMKVSIGGDSLDPYLYDRDNYPGAAADVINALRTK